MNDREHPPVVTYENVGQAAYVTINRPTKRNALSIEVIAKLRLALHRARGDDAARVVVLTGAGGRCFSAGGDLAEMGAGESEAVASHHGRGGLGRIFEELWGMGKPTIAKVEGICLAGGMGLALACDFVLAGHDAVFGTPEVKRGLFPYMISVPLLRSMPPKTALRLMLTGERVDAAQGLAMGFVTEIAEDGELPALVASYVSLLAEASPQAVRQGRAAFYRTLDENSSAQLEYLQAQLTVTLLSRDAHEGLSAFQERRDPDWIVAASSATRTS